MPIMKRLILIVLSILLLFTVNTIVADDDQELIYIPLLNDKDNTNDNRSSNNQKIVSVYFRLLNTVKTTFLSDLGLVYTYMVNLTTGESYSAAYVSSSEKSSFIPLPDSSGYYMIRYTTELGEIYQGYFIK